MRDEIVLVMKPDVHRRTLGLFGSTVEGPSAEPGDPEETHRLYRAMVEELSARWLTDDERETVIGDEASEGATAASMRHWERSQAVTLEELEGAKEASSELSKETLARLEELEKQEACRSRLSACGEAGCADGKRRFGMVKARKRRSKKKSSRDIGTARTIDAAMRELVVPKESTRHGLVIGIEEYRDERLNLRWAELFAPPQS